MPWLKKKSYQGSTPMTVLSFTLSWSPHCCPQKQQCVLTYLSGSSPESTRASVAYARDGPNLWMVARSSPGMGSDGGMTGRLMDENSPYPRCPEVLLRSLG